MTIIQILNIIITIGLMLTIAFKKDITKESLKIVSLVLLLTNLILNLLNLF